MNVKKLILGGTTIVATIALVALPSTATAMMRFPRIGCDDLHYTYPNHYAWKFKPSGYCQTGPGLVGIEHARWHVWGKKRATARGLFVDGLGFTYAARITAYDLFRSNGPSPGVVGYSASYLKLHVVANGGERGGAFRGPFNVTLSVMPQE
jgi:hypothetical protein